MALEGFNFVHFLFVLQSFNELTFFLESGIMIW